MALSKATKKRTANNNTTLPEGIDFKALEQMAAEKANPGGAWVDGYYIPPGIDFNWLGQQGQQGQTAAATPTAPVVPVKTPEELMRDYATQAGQEVDTNADYMQGNAGLFNTLGQKLSGYDTQANYRRSDAARNDLSLEKTRGETLRGQTANLADRGINMGGVADKARADTNENFDITKINAADSLSRDLGGIEQNKLTAQGQFQNDQLALRRNIIDELIKRKSASVLAPVQGS